VPTHDRLSEHFLAPRSDAGPHCGYDFAYIQSAVAFRGVVTKVRKATPEKYSVEVLSQDIAESFFYRMIVTSYRLCKTAHSLWIQKFSCPFGVF